MRIEAPARIRKPLPLIPLVDVVFLLRRRVTVQRQEDTIERE